jgi:hypothetical protein
MKDKYDIAVEYLTAHPEQILAAWEDPSTHSAGCLFAFATADQDDACGCLTTIRRYARERAATESLTLAIRADKRIPCNASDIAPANLPVFAEWQRKIDAALDRK